MGHNGRKFARQTVYVILKVIKVNRKRRLQKRKNILKTIIFKISLLICGITDSSQTSLVTPDHLSAFREDIFNPHRLISVCVIIKLNTT